eukprot:scaffold1234_cov248-Pinguiococcus_pyrenoidosus.AAC.12
MILTGVFFFLRKSQRLAREDRVMNSLIKEADMKIERLLREEISSAMERFDRKATRFRELRESLRRAIDAEDNAANCALVRNRLVFNYNAMMRGLVDSDGKLGEVSGTDADLLLLLQSAASHVRFKEDLLVGRWDQSNTGVHRHTIADFQILGQINQGGTSKVFLGRRWGHRTLHAIKVMSINDIRAKHLSKRVQQERKILAKLWRGSPFVVTLYASFHDDRNLYMVMEHVKGGDLDALLEAVGPLAPPKALFFVAELTMALHFLHSSDIIHRDIKPANILITEDGHLKVADFGLSQIASTIPPSLPTTPDRSPPVQRSPSSVKDSSPRPQRKVSRRLSQLLYSRGSAAASVEPRPSEDSQGPSQNSDSYYSFCAAMDEDLMYSAVGTLDYLAPEVIIGSGHSFEVDWWSVGVVLFQMLTGRLPFNPGYVAEEERDFVFGNIVEARVIWPGTST